jgi:hypothetical protein
MEYWVTFEDVTGAELTGHWKQFITLESGILGHAQKHYCYHTYANFCGLLGSVVRKLSLDPRAQPIGKLQAESLKIIL